MKTLPMSPLSRACILFSTGENFQTLLGPSVSRHIRILTPANKSFFGTLNGRKGFCNFIRFSFNHNLISQKTQTCLSRKLSDSAHAPRATSPSSQSSSVTQTIEDVEKRVIQMCADYLVQPLVPGETIGDSAPILRTIDPRDLTRNTVLEDLVIGGVRRWDCLDTVEFILDVESVFTVTIPDEAADKVKTLNDVTQCVFNYLSGTAGQKSA